MLREGFLSRGLDGTWATPSLRYKRAHVETNVAKAKTVVPPPPRISPHTRSRVPPCFFFRENEPLIAQEGAEGFLKVQYTAIAKMAVFLLVFIVFSYVLRPASSEELRQTGVRRIGNTMLGVIAGGCFLVGALCSAAVGYISM